MNHMCKTSRVKNKQNIDTFKSLFQIKMYNCTTKSGIRQNTVQHINARRILLPLRSKQQNYLHFTKPHDKKRLSEDTWCRFAEEIRVNGEMSTLLPWVR